MPGQGWNGNQVVVPDLVHRIAHQAAPRAADDHHGVRVLMAFQRRVAVRLYFEIAQFSGEIVTAEQLLARHGAKGRGAFLLVIENIDLRPAEAALALEAPDGI